MATRQPKAPAAEQSAAAPKVGLTIDPPAPVVAPAVEKDPSARYRFKVIGGNVEADGRTHRPGDVAEFSEEDALSLAGYLEPL